MEDDSAYTISAKQSKQSKLTNKFEEILMAEAELLKFRHHIASYPVVLRRPWRVRCPRDLANVHHRPLGGEHIGRRTRRHGYRRLLHPQYKRRGDCQ